MERLTLDLITSDSFSFSTGNFFILGNRMHLIHVTPFKKGDNFEFLTSVCFYCTSTVEQIM